MNRLHTLSNTLLYHWRRSNWMLDPRRLVRDYVDVAIRKPIFFLGNQGGGLTLIGRARGKRFVALSGHERIVFDADLKTVDEEAPQHRRKGALPDAPDVEVA